MSPRKLSIALTLAIVLEAVEILRRAPRWLLLVCAFLLYLVVLTVVLHPWWAAGAAAVVFVVRMGRRRIGRLWR